jgi:tetratricopeptide (TPR) repeat protein
MEETNCPRCGGILKVSLKFCPHCGFELPDATDAKASTGRRRLHDFIIIILVLFISVIGYLAFTGRREKAGDNTDRIGTTHGRFDAAADSTGYAESYEDLVRQGNGFMDQHSYDMAIGAYSRALAIDSTDPNVMTDMGVCFYALGKPQQAIALFDQAIALDSGHAIAYFNLGIVHREMNDREKARACWKKVMALQPGKAISDTVRKYLEQMTE